MKSSEVANTTVESASYGEKLRRAMRLGIVASVLATGQFMEDGLSINSENPLYQRSKTADTINVAVVDYTGSLDEVFEKETEEVFDQVIGKDSNERRPSIDIDVDVLQPSHLNKMIVSALPESLNYESVFADMTAYRSATDYESVVSVVDKDARSNQLSDTKYSRVIHHEGESQTQAAITTVHELGHQLELGHVWSFHPGKTSVDLAGRRFIDIHEFSSIADYDSYDTKTGNVMGSTLYGGKHEEVYVSGDTGDHEHSEGIDVPNRELDLTGMQLDRLYHGSDGYEPLGIELTPDTYDEEVEIAVGTHHYVKTRYPEGLEWDDNAHFAMSSGYDRIAIDSLVLEPVTYEQDGETMVSYRLYLADDSEKPQMLYVQNAYTDHPASEDSEQHVVVNGLSFDVKYHSETKTVQIRVVEGQKPLGGQL